MPRIKGASHQAASAATQERLIASAGELLSTVGFAQTTTRAIAERSGCNQALISYHFGSLNQLLLAALDASVEARLGRYRHELDAVSNGRRLRRLARRLYREDREAGHVRLLGEMVAGGLMDRDLGRQVAQRVQPWTTLVEDTIRRLLPQPLRRRVPVSQLAYGVVAGFLGLVIIGELFEDHSQGDALLDRLTAERSIWKLLVSWDQPQPQPEPGGGSR